MDWQVIQGDSLEIMPTLSGVQAVITDPPYGLSFKGEGWDASIPDWLSIARALSDTVVFTSEIISMWQYPTPSWVCCWHREASNSHSKLGGFCNWSPILVYGKPKFRVDTIRLHAIQHATSKAITHPSPKPIALMIWLVESCTKEGDTVVDPFMGSGSTGVACLITGRKFIGIERDPAYCEMARMRLRRSEGLGYNTSFLADLEAIA